MILPSLNTLVVGEDIFSNSSIALVLFRSWIVPNKPLTISIDNNTPAST